SCLTHSTMGAALISNSGESTLIDFLCVYTLSVYSILSSSSLISRLRLPLDKSHDVFFVVDTAIVMLIKIHLIYVCTTASQCWPKYPQWKCRVFVKFATIEMSFWAMTCFICILLTSTLCRML